MAKSKLIETRLGPDIPEVNDALASDLYSDPEARIRSDRRDSVTIRVRIVDPSFRGLDRSERHDRIFEALKPMPGDLFQHLSLLLLLTPEETRESPANEDFEHPIPSKL